MFPFLFSLTANQTSRGKWRPLETATEKEQCFYQNKVKSKIKVEAKGGDNKKVWSN